MQPFVPELTEAELRAATQQMYDLGGIKNILNCLTMMQWCQSVIMVKLSDILRDEQHKNS